MKVLVTGAGGFVGGHVRHELREHGHECLALDFVTPGQGRKDEDLWLEVDISEARAVADAVKTYEPDACVHLAAMSFIPEGDEDPQRMLSINVGGTLNVLDAFRHQAPGATVLVVTSAQVYGTMERSGPVTEESSMAPVSLYGVSKASADLMSRVYSRVYGMHVMTTRPYNHIGPGQGERFAVASLARQVKAIAESGAEPRMQVGNLDSARDFTDVRDVARAYRALLERGRAGHAYNIASGHSTTIGKILEMLCEVAGVKPEIEVDPGRHRPTDSFPVLDTTKILTEVGWVPEISLHESLVDILAAA